MSLKDTFLLKETWDPRGQQYLDEQLSWVVTELEKVFEETKRIQRAWHEAPGIDTLDDVQSLLQQAYTTLNQRFPSAHRGLEIYRGNKSRK